MSRTESLSDIDEGRLAAVEADLERLLAIEPSADFAARVRARIDAHAPRRRGWRWRAAGLTAAAAAILLVIVTLGELSVGDNTGPISSPPPRHHDIVLDGPPAERNRTFARSTNRAARSNGAAHRPAQRAAEAEIIIDPSVAEAIRRVMTSAGKTSLQTAPDGWAEQKSLALTVAEPLDVPELVLRPAEQWARPDSVGSKKE